MAKEKVNNDLNFKTKSEKKHIEPNDELNLKIKSENNSIVSNENSNNETKLKSGSIMSGENLDIETTSKNEFLNPNANDDTAIKDVNSKPLKEKKSENKKQKKIKPKINPAKVVDLSIKSKDDLNKVRKMQHKLNSLTLFKKILFIAKLSKWDRLLLKQYSEHSKNFKENKKTDFNKQNIFEIKDFNLWYLYGDKQALFEINTEIKKNEVTAFIGPSGCGKSTFLRSLNRMNDLIPHVVHEGDIWFNGKHLLSKKLSKLELRTRIGMVFQKATPFEMSIYENVAYGPKSHGIKDKKTLDTIVEKALKGAALWEEVSDDLDQLGSNLSGGQQQRLCIARTIALEPEVILMDEPTSALDPIATNKIEKLIRELKGKYTVIIVTHSMAQAQRISDRTIFFYQGKIIEEGTTKQIFTRPVEKRTRDYISGRIG